uniref:Uncharacterized protein n=1 Tax=Romanomermis culicivorax TaxID=13658 RepID=A0A915I7G7_ROMCU
MVNGALPFFVYSACSRRFRNIAIAQFLGPKDSIHDPTGQHASAIVLSNRGKCSGNGRNGSTNSVSLIKSLKRQSLTRLLSSGPSSAAAIFDTSIPKILNTSDKKNSENMESVI